MEAFCKAHNDKCVQILTRIDGVVQGWASGFIVDSNETNTMIMTCGHALDVYFGISNLRVHHHLEYFVVFEEVEHCRAEIITTYGTYNHEVGLLWVEDPKERQFFEFEDATTDGMSLGVFGFPRGLSEISHAFGWLSRHSVPYRSVMKSNRNINLIEYDNETEEGASGFGVLSEKDLIVAINIIKTDSFRYGVSIPTIRRALGYACLDFEDHERVSIRSLLRAIFRRQLASDSSDSEDIDPMQQQRAGYNPT